MLSVAAAAPSAAADGVDAANTAPAHVEVALIGPETLVRPVHDVLDELLSRDGVSVSWSRLDRLRFEDILETSVAGEAALISAWIDVSSAVEARIYFRAARDQRFVIRRLSLPVRPGPVVVEEIAQIVKSVLRALRSDTGWALSMSEARAALREQAPSPRLTLVPESKAPVETARQLAVEVGSAAVAEMFARQVPLSGRLELSLAAISRPAGTPFGFPGELGGWLAFRYGLAARFRGEAVGAEIQTHAFRAGLLWEPWRWGRVTVRLSLGGGFDRSAFQPRAEMPGATPAAPGTFVSAIGCLAAGIRFDVSRRFALAAAALADISAARIHYDAYDSNGTLSEVLAPFRVRPGLSLGVDFRL